MNERQVVDEDDIYGLPDEMTESGGYAKLLVLKVSHCFGSGPLEKTKNTDPDMLLSPS